MRILSTLLAAVAVALLAIPAAGQNCVRNRAVFCPTIVNTYATPVYAHQAVVAVEVPTALDYYYSLGSYYQSQLIADAVVGKLLLLQQQPGKPTAGKMPAATPAGKGVSLTPGQDAPDARLAKVVNDSCLRCHSGAKAGGSLDLSNLAAVPELQRYKVFAFVNDGRMPKGGNPLPDDQAKLFADWAAGFKAASR